MNNISFQYPTWYILLCLLLGIAFALALYFRDRRFREQSTSLNWGLGILRALLVTFLSALLLSPLLRSIITDTQKPIVVLAQDVSESVGAEMGEAALGNYKNELSQLRNQLAEEYDLVTYSFGEDIREGIDSSFSDKVSNLSDMLATVYDLYGNQNLGAVILASDGIYNQGSNPIYSSSKLNAPIYTIALGDTIPKRDLIVKRAFHNKIAYLGDRFAVQIDVAAKNCTGQNTNLVLSKIVNGDSQTLQSIPININQEDFFTTREVILEANEAGVQRYRIALSSVNGEASRVNNVKDFFVEVLDARQKILLLANAPHPDLTAIKQTLSANKNYELNTAYITDLQANLLEYDFVILHQLPSKTNTASNVLNTIKNHNIAHLFIVGGQSNLGAFNRAQDLLTIRGDGRNTDEVQALIQNDFSLFTLNEELKREIRQFPPLVAPFGEYKTNPNSSVLLRQQIGRVETPRPLFLLGESAGTKVGVLAAEGIWKWRLFDYLQRNNHEFFNELLGKSVQYLSLKEDKRRFRVNLDQNIFNENETIVFGAQLYNQSYELVNDAEANIVITSTEGKEYSYIFNKTEDAYSLNAGILPVGNYRFRAATTFNGQQLTYEGQFSVQPIQLELYETTADHGLLRILSEEYAGETIFPDQVNGLAELIQAKGNVKPVIYQTTQTRSIINLKWIFFILLALLSVEWFLRRYFGSY
ncbi:MAG: hypothetical protein AAF849_14555 [Bacteroidota bacterium]